MRERMTLTTIKNSLIKAKGKCIASNRRFSSYRITTDFEETMRIATNDSFGKRINCENLFICNFLHIVITRINISSVVHFNTGNVLCHRKKCVTVKNRLETFLVVGVWNINDTALSFNLGNSFLERKAR